MASSPRRLRGMRQSLAKRIRTLRVEKLRLSQEALGELIGVKQPTVSRWEKAEDTPEEPHLRRLAELAECSLSEFRYGFDNTRVVVVGYVGAGEAVVAFDDHAQGAGLDTVEPPPDNKDLGLVALQIRGNSMRPLKDGWYVYYRRDQEGVPDECINDLCVVRLVDGRTLIKEVRRGYASGRFNLLSWTAGVDPMEDVELEWASPVAAITRG